MTAPRSYLGWDLRQVFVSCPALLFPQADWFLLEFESDDCAVEVQRRDQCLGAPVTEVSALGDCDGNHCWFSYLVSCFGPHFGEHMMLRAPSAGSESIAELFGAPLRQSPWPYLLWKASQRFQMLVDVGYNGSHVRSCYQLACQHYREWQEVTWPPNRVNEEFRLISAVSKAVI